ncbi:YciC family protein [Buchnera aphidicola (Chaitoregma tattakana)]|uniref:YciC family protein n=1 Tax=Buchnera aphidicola TaxID=9 RepID=UPI0031B877F6
MFIKETDLFIETLNFVKKNWIKLCLVSIFFSFTIIVSDYYIIPTIQKIYFTILRQDRNMYSLVNIFDLMTFSQQKTILQFSFLRNIFFIINLTFIIESIMMIIYFKVCEKKESLYKIYKMFFSIFPNLFLLIFFINLIIQAGLVLLIFPAIIFSIFFSISPIILIIERKGILFSLKKSFLICLSKYKELSFPIIMWLCSKFVLLMIGYIFSIRSENFFLFLYYIISNFFLCMLIVYLFKFYSLFNAIKKF